MLRNSALSLAVLLAAYTSLAAGQTLTYGTPVVNNTSENPNGTPCGSGSVGKVVSGDGSFVTLIFDDLSAQIGPGISKGKNRGYCDVDMDIQVSSHIYSFAIDILDYRGYARLDKGVTGTVTGHHQFLNFPNVASFSQSIAGPMNDDYNYRQNNTATYNRFSPCATTTKVKVAVAVELASSDPNATGFLKEDSIDLGGGGRNAFNVTLKFATKNCLK